VCNVGGVCGWGVWVGGLAGGAVEVGVGVGVRTGDGPSLTTACGRETARSGSVERRVEGRADGGVKAATVCDRGCNRG
jgi:hypothetical protein